MRHTFLGESIFVRQPCAGSGTSCQTEATDTCRASHRKAKALFRLLPRAMGVTRGDEATCLDVGTDI